MLILMNSCGMENEVKYLGQPSITTSRCAFMLFQAYFEGLHTTRVLKTTYLLIFFDVFGHQLTDRVHNSMIFFRCAHHRNNLTLPFWVSAKVATFYF